MDLENYMADYDSYLNFLVLEANDYEGVVVDSPDQDQMDYVFNGDDQYAVTVEAGKKVAVMDGFFRVNKSTGEIIGEYVKSPYKGITRKEYEKEYKIVPSPINARNTDDIKDYIKLNVDKRRVVTYNNIDNRAYEAAGRAKYGDAKGVSSMTKPQYKMLQQIAEHLSFHNVIVARRKDLALLLNIKENHIIRCLKVVSDYVRVVTEDVQRGYIKLVVSPDLLFKTEGRKMYQLREQAMTAWYLQSHKPWTNYSEHIEWLMKPQERVVVDIEDFEFNGKKFSKEFIAWLDSWKKSADHY